MKKIEPLKVLITRDKLVAIVSIARGRPGAAAASGETIVAILEPNKFNCVESKKTIDATVWKFVKSKELETKFRVHADPLVQTERCFSVQVSEDLMTAHMDINVEPGMCGMLREEVIRRIMVNAGVSRGIRDDNLKYIIKKYNESPGQESGLVVAEGGPEIQAVDTSVELSELFKHRVTAQKKTSNKKTTTVSTIATDYSLPRNSLLLRIILGQKGKEGFTVTGQKIWHDDNSKTVKNPWITMNRNIREDIRGYHIDYYSTVEGRASFIDNKILDVEEALNGRFELTVKSDRMSCSLQLQAPKDGKGIDYQQIVDRITEREIKAPMALDDVKAAVDELNALNNHETRILLLARGTPPVNGLNEKIKLNVDLETVYTPRVAENGVIDYRGGPRFPFVRGGEVAGILYPATEGGEPGTDVLGNPVEPRDGEALGLALNESFELIDEVREDRPVKLLRAKTSGLLVKNKNAIIIDPVFKADEINYSTGNIDFDGTVIIKETIADGFRVRATKDIHIGGSIGACTVESKRSVIIKGGVNGRKTGRIAAEKDVYAKFAENCHVQSKGDMYLSSHCLLSDLVSGSKIYVGMNHTKGRVIGSRLYAWHLIRTDFVGSEKTSIDSTLWVGVNKPIHEEMRKLKPKMDRVALEIPKIDSLLEAARRSNPGAVSELTARREAQSEELEKMTTLYQDLTEKAYNNDRPSIEILQKMQEHSIVKLATENFDMRNPAEKTRLHLAGNEIKAEKL